MSSSICFWSTATCGGFQTWGAEPPASKVVRGGAPRKILPKCAACVLWKHFLAIRRQRPSGGRRRSPQKICTKISDSKAIFSDQQVGACWGLGRKASLKILNKKRSFSAVFSSDVEAEPWQGQGRSPRKIMTEMRAFEEFFSNSRDR